MNNQFRSDSAAKGAAFLDQKISNKNTDIPISACDTCDTCDKTKETNIINELDSGNLSHQAENIGVTRGDKPLF